MKSSVADSLFETVRIRFVATAILIVAFVLLGVSFASAPDGGRTPFGPLLGVDFTGFYTAGYILNHYPPAQLYDATFQDEVYHQVHPAVRVDETMPFVHPPFVAWAFRPLARLPYPWAFAVWLPISLGLYVLGLLLTLRSVSLPASDRVTALLLGLSFQPFVLETWLGGQLAAVGFCCLAAGIALDRRGRPLLAGLVLGLCFYKPTLLLVALPVLLAGRRFWTLAGIARSGLALAGLTLTVVGWEGTLAFVRVLTGFAHTATGTSQIELKLWKYVDLNNAATLLLGVSWAQRLVFAVLALPPLAWLLLCAWRSDWSNPRRLTLLWASVALAALVVNVYVGVYDSVLAVLGALLLVDALGCTGATMPSRLRYGLAALYVVPWFSQPLGKYGHVQLFTLVLLGLTWYSLSQVRRGCPVLGDPDIVPKAAR